MSIAQRIDGIPLRRTDSSERIVAFAFAAADLVAEVDPGGTITFCDGLLSAACRSPWSGVPCVT